MAREICNLVYFKGMKLQDAADQVIHHELETLHGDGGIIAIATFASGREETLASRSALQQDAAE